MASWNYLLRWAPLLNFQNEDFQDDCIPLIKYCNSLETWETQFISIQISWGKPVSWYSWYTEPIYELNEFSWMNDIISSHPQCIFCVQSDNVHYPVNPEQCSWTKHTLYVCIYSCVQQTRRMRLINFTDKIRKNGKFNRQDRQNW